MARPASESLHALLTSHGIAADELPSAELSDADLERVVGGKGLRRRGGGGGTTSESKKPNPSGDNKVGEKPERFFDRQSQNANSN
jgi:hypothetical protein